MDIGSRIKEERERLRLSQAEFGELAGVKQQAQLNYEKNTRSPDANYLHNLSTHGVDIQYIITGNRTAEGGSPIFDNAGHPIDLEEFCFIPRYNVSASAGFGAAIPEESYEFSMAYRRYWITEHLDVNPNYLIAITAKGDSMIGVIEDKDVLLVDTSNKIYNEGIFVLRIDGDLIVKSIQKLPNRIIEVSSTNPMYKPFRIDLNIPPNDFEVIGCVVHTESATLFRHRRFNYSN